MGCSPSREEVRREDGLQEAICTQSKSFLCEHRSLLNSTFPQLPLFCQEKNPPEMWFSKTPEALGAALNPKGCKKKEKPV
jgi:hypothetical protein